ncbi:MAG: heavy metal-binding domain-containing protein [Bacteriovorax sp.]|nr:heavy metal-binding domain-containing protein [Bacteriovorax sp.]
MINTTLSQKHRQVTGLSGNEIYCLNKLDYRPGQLCVGNSVVALGVTRGIGAGLSNLGGGEVEEITQLVHDGRMKAIERLMNEAREAGGVGLSGVSFELINHGGNLEFLAIGSAIRTKGLEDGEKEKLEFSTAANVQQLYCQIDSGFKPLHFVFGNVAYSIGIGGNIMGSFKSLKRGEVKEFTEIFDKTRHLALTRMKAEAKKVGANSIIGIETTLAPLMGAQEMLMIGTASHHPLLDEFINNPVTSDMTNEEMWNMVNIGYMPIQLVMGVSVYSLGFAGGVMSLLQSLGGGEVEGLTEILYEAREKALARIQQDAVNCGADEVVGVKTRVYDLGGGMVEFMAIGTAVKKIKNVTTLHQDLPPQAIIQDRDTFMDTLGSKLDLDRGSSSSSSRMQKGPLGIIFFIFIVAFYIFKIFIH